MGIGTKNKVTVAVVLSKPKTGADGDVAARAIPTAVIQMIVAKVMAKQAMALW